MVETGREIVLPDKGQSYLVLRVVVRILCRLPPLCGSGFQQWSDSAVVALPMLAVDANIVDGENSLADVTARVESP